MTYQPVIPLSGYVGWRFLQRTMETQKTAFVESVSVQRATDYFREKIASVKTVDDLMGDRRLLAVALGAFGLDEDIRNKAFIRKVLDEGTLKGEAFANRLSDKRYAALALAFGFGNLGARTGLKTFPDEILAKYESKQFELAVGEQDQQMRLALNLGSGLKDVLSQATSKTAQWLGIMGSSPLRTVFQTALGFPSSFGAIDLDQQLTAFQDRARSVFGTDNLADFSAPQMQEKVIRLYMIRAEAASSFVSSGGSVALTLLRANG